METKWRNGDIAQPGLNPGTAGGTGHRADVRWQVTKAPSVTSSWGQCAIPSPSQVQAARQVPGGLGAVVPQEKASG